MYKIIFFSAVILSASTYADWAINEPIDTFNNAYPVSNEYPINHQGYPVDTYYNRSHMNTHYYQTQPGFYQAHPSQFQDHTFSQTNTDFNRPNRSFNQPTANTNGSFSNDNDRKLAQDIRNIIKSRLLSKGFEDVAIAVNNGDVTLSGTVERPDDIQRLQVAIRNVDGVRSLRTNLNIRNNAANQQSSANFR